MANCGSRDLVEGIGDGQAGAPIEAAFGTSMRIEIQLRIVADDSVISEMDPGSETGGYARVLLL